MTQVITRNEFDLLRQYIKDACGISLGDDKEYLIESRLARLLAETGSKDFGEFYLRVKSNPHSELRDKIVDAMTTNETLWFRDHTPFNILEKAIIPKLINSIVEGRRSRIRIWSAGCSTGQEPYSIAMVISECCRQLADGGVDPDRFEILGTDISPSALFLAIAGRYDKIQMSRGMTEQYRDKYFTLEGNIWTLDEKIKDMANYKRLNLQSDFHNLGSFDIIFCRNVAIYFSEEFKRDLFSRMVSALLPGAYFFVGSAENLDSYHADLAQKEYGKGVYFQLQKTEKAL